MDIDGLNLDEEGSSLLEHIFIEKFRDFKNFLNLNTIKNNLIQKIEKLIYRQNIDYSVFSQSFAKTENIEKYDIIKYSLNFLNKKIDKFFSFLNNELLEETLKYYFSLIFEKSEKNIFFLKINSGKKFNPHTRIYEKWINLVNYHNYDIIYLSLNIRIHYFSKQNFSFFLRINGEEDTNFLVYNIENFFDFENFFNYFNLNNNINNNFKIFFKTKISETQKKYSNFSKIIFYKTNDIKFNLTEGVKINQVLSYNNCTLFEKKENIFLVDENKIRGEKNSTLFKLPLIPSIYDLKSIALNQYSLVLSEKVVEWYEILNFFNTNNSIFIRDIDKNIKNFSKKQENIINKFEDLYKKVENNQIVIHSYGEKNLVDSKGRKFTEKWWRWENENFIENKSTTSDEGDEEIIYSYSGNKKLKEENFFFYKFEDLCKFDKKNKIYKTTKKGFDNVNDWTSEYIEDKTNKYIKCENCGVNKVTRAEWYETWIERNDLKFTKKTGKNSEENWEEEWKEKYNTENNMIYKKDCTKRNNNIQ